MSLPKKPIERCSFSIGEGDEVAELVRRTVREQMDEEGIILLTTADGRGHPHATWSRPFADTEERSFVALMSPDSRQATNLCTNNRVEWMFSSKDRSSIVYLGGTAQIILSPEKIRAYWLAAERHGQSLSLENHPSGGDSVVLRAEIDSIRLVSPEGIQKSEIGGKAFWENL